MSTKQKDASLKTAPRPEVLKAVNGAVRERPVEATEVDPLMLRRWSRRDLLIFGTGALATLTVGGSQLPRLLNQALRVDDNVSAALYSEHRLVPTYTKSQITPLRNNYNGATPDPSYIPDWHVTLDGLESGVSLSFN